jgi:hypothetical protein
LFFLFLSGVPLWIFSAFFQVRWFRGEKHSYEFQQKTGFTEAVIITKITLGNPANLEKTIKYQKTKTGSFRTPSPAVFRPLFTQSLALIFKDYMGKLSLQNIRH